MVVLVGVAERLEALARYLLLLECPFVIQQPPELRTVLRVLAAEIMALADRAE